MNKLILVIFGIVLTIFILLGFIYLQKSEKLSFLSNIPSFSFNKDKSLEGVKKEASKNCKNSGFYSIEEAGNYLADLIERTGANSEKYQDKELIQIIDLGNTCWGVWTGNENGEGIIFWEDQKGKIYQAESKIEL